MQFTFSFTPLEDAIDEICLHFGVSRVDERELSGFVTTSFVASSIADALQQVCRGTSFGYWLSTRFSDDDPIVTIIDRSCLDAIHSFSHSGGTAEAFFRHITGFCDLISDVRAKRFRAIEPFEMRDMPLRAVLDRISLLSGVRWTEEHGIIKIEAAEPGATDNPDDAQRLREDH